MTSEFLSNKNEGLYLYRGIKVMKVDKKIGLADADISIQFIINNILPEFFLPKSSGI
jgi:hypothetical protein